MQIAGWSLAKKRQICRPMAMAHQWHGNTFWLSGQRMMYWEEKQTLIASDLHLGKSGHFRKSGIAVPQQLMQQDLIRLFDQLQYFKPKRLLVVGDFFHSHANKELEWFTRWRTDLGHIEILLVKGNHDILHLDWYAQNQIDVCDHWEENNLMFVHEPEAIAAATTDRAIVCGHVHPGVNINGVGRQSLRLPCFYFGRQQCILPAFGLFTGTHTIKPKKADAVFAIADQTIIPLQ